MPFSASLNVVNSSVLNMPVEAAVNSLKDSLRELRKNQDYIVGKITRMGLELEARKAENDNFNKGVKILFEDIKASSSFLEEESKQFRIIIAVICSLAISILGAALAIALI